MNSSNYTGSVSGSSNNITISAAVLQGLSNGNHTLTANVSDAAGNAATQATATVAVSKIFTLSSWLDTYKQYKIFVVGSSAMDSKTIGQAKKIPAYNGTWTTNSNNNTGLLDSTTRSTHSNLNTATNKSDAGYGVTWVQEGPYWISTSSWGSPYGLADDHPSYYGQYDQSHISSGDYHSTQTAQYSGGNDYNSVFNLVKGSQTDAYRFECRSVTSNSSKNIFTVVSGYGGKMETTSGHPYGDFNKFELSPQWKGGNPTGPSTLIVNTGGSDITYECVCVTIKGDYDNTTYGDNLKTGTYASVMRYIYWLETVSWASSRRMLYLGVDGTGHTSYGGGNYYTWIRRYHGGGANSTTHGNSSTIAPTEFWICKIP